MTSWPDGGRETPRQIRGPAGVLCLPGQNGAPGGTALFHCFVRNAAGPPFPAPGEAGPWRRRPKRGRGWCRADALYFSVKDNGGGVEEETLVQLRELLQSEEINIEHNGLQNINRRIRLGYGGDSGLTIDSTEGKGFSVLLKLRKGEM